MLNISAFRQAGISNTYQEEEMNMNDDKIELNYAEVP